MTGPHDPYARPPEGDRDPGDGTPGYGEQPGYGQQPGYGEQPGYGQQPGGFGTTPWAQHPGGYGAAPPGYGQQSYGGDYLGVPAAYPELAPWTTRAGGYLIDFAISLAAQLLVGLFSEALGQLVGLAVFLYFGYLTGTTGQTPGRKAVNIRVVRERDGQLLGAGAGIGRAFLHILDALPLGLGYLWPLWDRKKQTFADKIIGSVVIRT